MPRASERQVTALSTGERIRLYRTRRGLSRERLSGLAGVSHCVTGGEALPSIDYHCALASLPLAFDTTLETIPSATPYLAVPDGARDFRHRRARFAR